MKNLEYQDKEGWVCKNCKMPINKMKMIKVEEVQYDLVHTGFERTYQCSCGENHTR